jgi:cysteine synthase A
MVPRAVDSILDAIGGTPLVKLQRLRPAGGADILVKCEHLNPSGSYKDRVALEMIRSAEADGSLKPGYTIIESSSGNTGTALSFIGTKLGYRVEIYMPKGMTPERVKLMEGYGATVHELDVEEAVRMGSVAGAEVEVIGRVTCLRREQSEPRVWWARQFSNPAGWRAQMGTGREIWEQADGKVDAFVASIGVGGALYGVARALKERNPSCRIIGLEPSGAKWPISEGYTSPPGVHPEFAGGIIKEMMASGLIEKVVKVRNEDAIAISDRMSREEGIFCGVSGGANVFYSMKVAEELGPGRRVATVLPDHGDRYFSGKKYTT